MRHGQGQKLDVDPLGVGGAVLLQNLAGGTLAPAADTAAVSMVSQHARTGYAVAEGERACSVKT